MRLRLRTLFGVLAFWLAGLTAVARLEGDMESVSNQLQRAQVRISALIRPSRTAVREGRLSMAEAARGALDMVSQVSAPYEKLLLFKGAIVLFAGEGEFAAIQEAFTKMTNEVSEVSSLMHYNVLRHAGEVAGETVTEDFLILSDQMMAKVIAEDLENRLKDDPDNVLLLRKLAEQYVMMENWDHALAAFARSSGELERMAKTELQGGIQDWKALGDFWWLKSEDKRGLLYEGYRVHARMLYKRGSEERRSGRPENK